MICHNCGTELEDYAAFCPTCGKMVIPPKQSPEGAASDEIAASAQDKPPKKVAQRLYPPVEPPLAVATAPEPPIEKAATDTAASAKPQRGTAKKAPKYNRRLVIFSVIMAIIAALSIGVAAYVLTDTHGMKVELAKAQTERASAEASVSSLGTQVSELQTTLESVKKERDDYSAEVTALTSQINSMESSVSQSTYDKESAERDLTQAQEDVKALSGQVTELQTQLSQAQGDLTQAQSDMEELQQDYDDLEGDYKAATDEIGFYDTYVVFVMLSSDTKYYHKYDCEDFTKRNFLAYSTKLAEANGYSKCPNCG